MLFLIILSFFSIQTCKKSKNKIKQKQDYNSIYYSNPELFRYKYINKNYDQNIQFNFLEYRKEFTKKEIKRDHAFDKLPKQKIDKNIKTADLIQSYSRSDEILKVQYKNHIYEYQKMYMHHNGDCWIESYMICLLNYYSLNDWKSFFDNFQKKFIEKFPFIEILETNNLKNYSSVSNGKLKDLFEDAKDIILKMKNPRSNDINLFDKDSFTNKKITESNLEKIVKFVRQAYITTEVIDIYYYHNRPITFLFFNKLHLENIITQNYNKDLGFTKVQQLCVWFLNLLKVLKIQVATEGKIKQKINDEIKDYFSILKIPNIDKLIQLLENFIHNLRQEFKNLNSSLYKFLRGLINITKDIESIYTDYNTQISNILGKTSSFNFFYVSTIVSLEQSSNLPYVFKNKLKDKRLLIIALLSKYNKENEIFIDKINDPRGYSEDFLKNSEQYFALYQDTQGGPKKFWGRNGYFKNMLRFFTKEYEIPEILKPSKSLNKITPYPLLYVDGGAYKDYAYRIK